GLVSITSRLACFPGHYGYCLDGSSDGRRFLLIYRHSRRHLRDCGAGPADYGGPGGPAIVGTCGLFWCGRLYDDIVGKERIFLVPYRRIDGHTGRRLRWVAYGATDSSFRRVLQDRHLWLRHHRVSGNREYHLADRRPRGDPRH